MINMLLRTWAVAALVAALYRPTMAQSPITEYVDRFIMPVTRDGCTAYHRPHSMWHWSTTPMGRCNRCKKAARMNSAAHGDTFILSWPAATRTEEEHIEDAAERRFGHLSTFTFAEPQGFQKVNDFWYEACNYDMGEIAWSKDGNVIGALCVGLHNMTIIGARGEPDYGSNNQAGRRNKMYLFEWTGGQITQNPDTIILLQTNIGGAKYGHWSLKLNDDASTYFVKLKVSTHFGGHESAVSYYIFRNEDHRVDKSISSATGCGGGHTISNRLTFNNHSGLWSQLCGVDSRRAVRWRTNDQKFFQLAEFPFGQIDYPAGGAGNMISLGPKGMMVSALGPPDILEGLPGGTPPKVEALKNQKIGIRKLPLTIDEIVANEAQYPWTWITPCSPTKGNFDSRRAGIVQLHNWGLGGETSGRYLLGYSPKMRFQGVSDEYHAVEINEKGEYLHDPVVLQNGGWGDDSLGVHMPGSGCVVFPYAWKESDTTLVTETFHGMSTSLRKRNFYLRLTALCPNGDPSGNTPFQTCTATQPTVPVAHPDRPTMEPGRPDPVCPGSLVPFFNGTGGFVYIDMTPSSQPGPPTSAPSVITTDAPSLSPSDAPTLSPSMSPTMGPSGAPSVLPTEAPTVPLSPSLSPTVGPSGAPSASPTGSPTEPRSPSFSPSMAPSVAPTLSPSEVPTEPQSPSTSPSDVPSSSPSTAPSESPSTSPSASPSQAPTDTVSPSPKPTPEPVSAPSAAPSAKPTQQPGPIKGPTINPPPIPPPVDGRPDNGLPGYPGYGSIFGNNRVCNQMSASCLVNVTDANCCGMTLMACESGQPEMEVCNGWRLGNTPRCLGPGTACVGPAVMPREVTPEDMPGMLGRGNMECDFCCGAAEDGRCK